MEGDREIQKRIRSVVCQPCAESVKLVLHQNVHRCATQVKVQLVMAVLNVSASNE